MDSPCSYMLQTCCEYRSEVQDWSMEACMRSTKLSQDEIRGLLEGHEDVITPAVKKEEALFRNTSCILCGAHSLTSMVKSNRPFSQGSILPNKILKCEECGCVFDPYTGLVHSAPTDESV